ncbi:hypothetical protein SCG7086_BC_00070 [Chlamydiales bacterium SCGC AG-110-P3]|nr:hypothetical protein SCG7086_BC_00070 [Chlamydiales bacterium SCGC AG-110-P3]
MPIQREAVLGKLTLHTYPLEDLSTFMMGNSPAELSLAPRFKNYLIKYRFSRPLPTGAYRISLTRLSLRRSEAR